MNSFYFRVIARSAFQRRSNLLQVKKIASPKKQARNDTNYLYYSTFILLLLLSGCTSKPPVETQPTASQEKLKSILKDEFKIDAVTKQLDNTLWIFVPLTEDMIKIQAMAKPKPQSVHPQEKLSIKYLNSEFKDMTFWITYDIGMTKSYAEDYGYQSKYTDVYTQNENRVLDAVHRAYADVEKRSGDNRYYEKIAGDVDYVGSKKQLSHKELTQAYVSTAPVPEFFVIVQADITNGFYRKILFYFTDFLRWRQDAQNGLNGFTEEFNKRAIFGQVAGDDRLIGDTEGKSLDYEDITWPNFLSQQMLNRVKFKYNVSDFPPSDDARKEILTCVKDTINSYHFTSFHSISLDDLNNEKDVDVINKAYLDAVGK